MHSSESFVNLKKNSKDDSCMRTGLVFDVASTAFSGRVYLLRLLRGVSFNINITILIMSQQIYHLAHAFITYCTF